MVFKKDLIKLKKIQDEHKLRRRQKAKIYKKY